jgi:Pentapeptide repeats (8 copies)
MTTARATDLLAGARLGFVDLATVSAPGADLAGAEIRFADARQARFDGLRAPQSFWEHASLRQADLTGADLRGATLRGCTLEAARLDGADLTDARLVMCSFDRASLRDCRLTDAVTVGCSFADADLTGARAFATCRDIVVEVLQRAVGTEQEPLEVIGAVALYRPWCYQDWWHALARRPHLRQRALDIFAAYPDSGFAEHFTAPS